ncbi:MAG: DDE-type integrase/transposase/recombinase [Candidatus Thiodiazotropha taylori]|nr:DDE-type integrase/transposase/recombinase [Candidatus Thiodiazotropha taylori]MCW4336964.1 RNase H-like domain-containing protein [Candidatus Thiodiazotropha endolucinida]
MYESNISELSADEKIRFKQLLSEFSDVFSKDDFDLGCLSGVEHKIQTYDEIPITEKFRRTPLHFQNQEKEYLDKLLKQGVIEPSVSDWSAAPVLVRKKSGELRYCIDYRALNAKTVKDNYSLPLIDDCLDSLYGKKLFCVLDLSSGYYQIPLEISARKKTSFNTRFGSFQWTRLAMGLCTAPATFQRAMQLVLRGLTWEEVIVYLDDIIVLGTDFQDALQALRKVFCRFREHNLKFKPRKCQFFKTEVEFLGKLVSGNGISISPDKLEAVKSWPIPTDSKQLLSFLGFMNYHRNHIPDFAKVSSDLYALAHAKTYYWSDRHQACFNKLKQLAISAQVLAHPSPDGLFILDTDASGDQIGAELSQFQNGIIRPICYASHILMKAHRNYCTTRKELLAIVKFCRQFRHYLLGRFFLIRTDHNSLVWLMRFKYIEGQLARFIEELSQYNFKILHRKGAEHTNADALSRIRDPLPECDCYRAGMSVDNLPCGGCDYCRRAHRQWARFNEDVDDVIPLAVRSIQANDSDQPLPRTRAILNWVDGLSSLQLGEAQRNDPSIGLVMHWLEHCYEPTTRELQLCSPETRALWMTRDQLVFQDNVMYYSWTYREGLSKCLVVPKELRDRVLYFCHDSKDSGHLGQTKTLDRLKEKFYWYGMSRDSDIYVKQCTTCNKNKKGNRTARSALETYHAGYPMERVHLDILGPFNRSKSGSAYILVMVDQFTKWVELAALPAQNAELTARAFLNHFIVTFGCPLEVHTDQGRNFESELFQAFCKLLEITKTRTTPYHPSGNGQCEIFNRVILQMIRSYLSRGVRDWDEHLPLISMALHSMKNKSTGFSANMLMLGRETIQPIDLIIGLPKPTPQDPPTWVANLTRNLSNVHDLAREKIGQTQLRQKRDYDLRVLQNSYHPGDVVYLRDSSTKIGISSKLRPPWTGPFLIASARPPVYKLLGRKKTHVVHHDRLKPCNDSSLPLWLQRKRHNLLNTLPIGEEEDQDSGSDDVAEDYTSDVGLLFDPDETLPYMMGDPEETLPYMMGSDLDDSSSGEIDSESDLDIVTDHSGDPESELTTHSPERSQLPPSRTTRAGRKTQLPARYKD